MEKAGFKAAKATTCTTGVGPTEKNKPAVKGNPKTYMQLTGPNRKVYLMEAGNVGKLQTLSTELAAASFAGLVTDNMPVTVDNTKWEGWMATVEEEIDNVPKASINWTTHTRDTNTTDLHLSQGTKLAFASTMEFPFFVDSGVTVHISPYRSNFSSLQPIVPKAIKGVGGSTISAHGIGCIQLHTTEGAMLSLQNALYVL